MQRQHKKGGKLELRIFNFKNSILKPIGYVILGLVIVLGTGLLVPETCIMAKAESASSADFKMDGTTLKLYQGTFADDVTIPKGTKSIAPSAFQGHSEIITLTIPDSVETIGSGAFEGCEGLQYVNIPNSVVSIGSAAFSKCTSLSSVSLGKNLTELGSGVFAGCSMLGQCTIDKNNIHFIYENGVIYNKSKDLAKNRTVLYQMLPGCGITYFEVPQSVEKIKEYAFWGCYSLEQIVLSQNMKEIPNYCFSNCQRLKYVSIPFSVKRIDLKAFEDCISLKTITIPPSVLTIHDTAFDGCINLDIEAEEGSYADSFVEVRNANLENNRIIVSTRTPKPKLEGEEESVDGEADSEALSDGSREKEIEGTGITTLDGTKSGAFYGDKSDAGNVSKLVRYNPLGYLRNKAEGVLGQTRVIGGKAYILIKGSDAEVKSGN